MTNTNNKPITVHFFRPTQEWQAWQGGNAIAFADSHLTLEARFGVRADRPACFVRGVCLTHDFND